MKADLIIEAVALHTRTIRKIGNVAGVYLPKDLVGATAHIIVSPAPPIRAQKEKSKTD